MPVRLTRRACMAHRFCAARHLSLIHIYRKVRLNCIACIGQVGNVDHANIAVGKAGRKRHMGIRPTCLLYTSYSTRAI